jgi:tetratricopeptide (TPR) repeat protein/TolB-like protein
MSLVEQALVLPPDQREAYVRSACASDRDLFDQVWNYVQWEQRMNGFLLDPLYPPPVIAEHPFEPDELLDGRFHIIREVGQGGMGVVYEAVDEKLEKRIALKCAKAGFSKRLPKEVRHATEIAHPNVCRIFEIHTASTRHGEVDFFTMEFLEGETLAERLRRGRLPDEEARTIALQLCAGLAEAHRKGVVHGDLKSNNLILAARPDGAIHVLITDFGLARRIEVAQRTAQSGEIGGTPAYMAPELWKAGNASIASDIYAMGVILYELASGKKPHGPDVSWEERLTRKPPPLHSKWDPILARCLHPSPAQRFRDADAVARALTPRSRRWFLAAAAGVVLAILTGVVTYQRATTPAETVRLAVLPFETDAATAPVGAGLLQDTGDRLSRVKGGRASFTLIPLKDALRNKVDRAEQAESRLGATHTLSGILRQENGRILVRAYLTETRTRLNLVDWSAGYAPSELRNLPVAMAGMVTGTLRLPPLAQAAAVNAKAYPAWAEGVSLARGDSKDIDRALDLLEHAVAADPSSPLTHACLAEAELQKYLITSGEQWWNRARDSLKTAEHLNPDVAAVRSVSGLINRAIGHYDEAQADLKRAIEIEPMNGDLWRQLGSVYRRSNRSTEALAALQKAIQLQPGYFKNYEELGDFYYDRYEFEEAVRQYKRMVELAPGQSYAHFLLSTPYLNMGRYSDAEDELRLAMKIQETSDVVHTLSVSLMYQDRDREAIPYYLRALELGPPPANKYLLYLNLGTSYRRSKQPKEGERAYRKALELAYGELEKNPKNGYIRSCVAYLLARLGDRQGAEANAVQALGLTPGDVNVPWMVALTYEALEERERTLSLIRDGPDWLLSRLNRFPDLADLQKDLRFQQLIASHHIQ